MIEKTKNKLPEACKLQTDQEITEEEVKAAIKAMRKRKSARDRWDSCRILSNI